MKFIRSVFWVKIVLSLDHCMMDVSSGSRGGSAGGWYETPRGCGDSQGEDGDAAAFFHSLQSDSAAGSRARYYAATHAAHMHAAAAANYGQHGKLATGQCDRNSPSTGHNFPPFLMWRTMDIQRS
ncbi:hypothetical protein B566_EDAN006907 [Ephemera danica]|nr:hypothetical protein B566_EDAN006907 [Ephemera danica]